MRLSNGEITEIMITPEDAGLERAPLTGVTGADVDENAARFRALLDGDGNRAEQDVTILNAAALLWTAGKSETLRQAADLARDALLSGRAGAVLDSFIEASNA